MPWLPADFTHPMRVRVAEGAHIRPISADDLAIDMPAVMGNQPMLWAKYGAAWGWPPTTMTPEQDRDDLARHADEMERHESFNYAILPADESVLWGCIYIDPAEVGGGAAGDTAADDSPADARAADAGEAWPGAEVSWWVVPDAPAGLAGAVRDFVPGWLRREWPFAAVRYPFGEVD